MKNLHAIYCLIALLCLTLSVNARRMAPIRRDLLDGSYTLVKLYDGNTLKTVSGIKSTITVKSKDTSITAYFGCNRMSGRMQTSNYAILPFHLISTEMFCTDKINQVESGFAKQMEGVTTFTIKANLVTFYQDDEVRMVLKKTVAKKKK